jgi:hypothetical protein
MWLDHGVVKAMGNAKDVSDAYHDFMSPHQSN